MNPLRKSIIPTTISNQNDGGKDTVTHTGGLLIFTSYAMMISPSHHLGLIHPTLLSTGPHQTANCRVTYKKIL